MSENWVDLEEMVLDEGQALESGKNNYFDY